MLKCFFIAWDRIDSSGNIPDIQFNSTVKRWNRPNNLLKSTTVRARLKFLHFTQLKKKSNSNTFQFPGECSGIAFFVGQTLCWNYERCKLIPILMSLFELWTPETTSLFQMIYWIAVRWQWFVVAGLSLIWWTWLEAAVSYQ